MALKIAFGFEKDKRGEVAGILYEAFEDKYAPVYGRKHSIPIMAKYLRSDRTVIATIDADVVGVAGLNFNGREFIDISLWQELFELKLGIFRALFNGWVFSIGLNEKELHINDLAVASDMRGKGIGTSMLEFIMRFAQSKGYEEISLLVIDRNKMAKKLYERMGFREEKIRKLHYPWTIIFGFKKMSKMVLKVTTTLGSKDTA